ncbi:DNA repair protein [Westerdykella ornata]|uniref:DNA repair protein REV1 n=1 Tax=Westerdykella ornata TaxID=318751 RepID=A0A6A6J763_WESOR|nr:DNA repair protein [Westerdykella ornata]KAF2272235.1 DNA repair protein [Westerdykella ornata]
MGSRLERNSDAVRKRIASHTFDDEDGEEYEGSTFGGFGDYFRRKKLKLQNLDADIRAQSVDKPALFKGVVAHVNGYTQPSLNDLHKLIVQHGGGFLQYLDGKTAVTHIIASSLTPKKAVDFKRYRIVKPAWIVDSIAAGRLLPWNDYRVVDEGEKQKVLALSERHVHTQTNVRMRGYREQTESSWYTSQLRDSRDATPNSSLRLRFSKQRLPSPDDEIEEDILPPSHQPELVSSDGKSDYVGGDSTTPARVESLVTPPKTSPPLELQEDVRVNSESAALDEEDDTLYAEPTIPRETNAGTLSPDQKDVESLPSEQGSVRSPKRKRELTAEEHNAILLRDPKIRKSTVVDPNFLEQYYRESRLHHLSTWKADLKSQLQALANEKISSAKSKAKRPPGARRYILHVDFDSFFAAVSLKNHPEWKDKPAVVAHGTGSGSEIASCNYAARKFGISNGMWMKRAQELCPELKVLPYDFPAYEEASRAFYDAILATDGVVQSVSIDEALIDVSAACIEAGGSDGKHMSEGSVYREQTKAEEIAQALRNEVKQKTECNVSVGIGGNILLARLALRKAKPAGQYQIKPEEMLDFIGGLEVKDLPGVAWSIGGKLEEIGVKYVKDIRELTKERLVQALGPKTGQKLYEYSRGIDKTEVGEQVVRKSVSAEVNWGVRFENQEQVDEFIGSLCGELQKRLLKEKVKGKQFTMKVMKRSPDAPLDPPKHLGHGKCDTFNKSLVLGVATNAKEVLAKEALSILKGFGFSPGELRGIGVQMTKLEPMKSATDGSVESSQRRLQFKMNTTAPVSARKPPKAVEADPIQDDPETPKKPKHGGTDHVAFGATALNQSTPSRRPLNTLGTQFLLPSQVDPKVLAELPEHIRSKLLRQSHTTYPTPDARPGARSSRGLSPTPAPRQARAPFALTALPAHSQLDPEILAALPPDVRAEVLAQYAAGGTPGSPARSPHRRQADQTVLPQSPRKNKLIGIPSKKPIVPPVKRGRGRPPRSAQLTAAAAATAKCGKTGQTLTQANFILPRAEQIARGEGAGDDESDGEERIVEGGPDKEFLAALPEDLRKEVLEDYMRQKLKASRLAVPAAAHPLFGAAVAAQEQVPVKREQIIRVPRPVRPTFTKERLSEEQDLRAAMKHWVNEYRDEGPYKEDADALARYLGRVVSEEGDLAKAVGVVTWLRWLVEEMSDEGENACVTEEVLKEWREALGVVKSGVLEAARKRGLGDVAFD